MDFHKFWNSMVSVTPTFITKHDVIIRFLEAEAELTVILSYRISRWIYFEQNVNTARRRFDIVWNKKAGNTKLEYPNKLLKFQNLFFFKKNWLKTSFITQFVRNSKRERLSNTIKKSNARRYLNWMSMNTSTMTDRV